MKLDPFDPSDAVQVSANGRRDGGVITFNYELSGDTSDIIFASTALPARRDGLWQSTCFEAFAATGPTSYVEFNFAPSGDWAAYRFTAYREGMEELSMPAPEIAFDGHCLTARVDLPKLAGAPLNLTAVLQHRDGGRSYWALAHPDAERPDFHARDCFVARLP